MPRLRVSVLIPCYNAEAFIGQAIESALSQSLPPDEIVVVDDGSNDGSVRAAAAFGERVRVISRAHEGVGAARNAALAAAQGDLVAWLDADDVWEPGKLAAQVPRFEDSHIGLVYGQIRRLGAHKQGPPWPTTLLEGDIFEQLYLRRNFISCSSVILRRQALIDAGGFDGSVAPAEDIDAWLRVAAQWRVAAVPRVLCRYRIHPQQISGDHAYVIRRGLRVREKLAPQFERRTGISFERRRQLLARTFLGFVSRLIASRNMKEARAVASVLQEAFASDSPRIRYAIARKRLVASLPPHAFWLHACVKKVRRSVTRIDRLV